MLRVRKVGHGRLLHVLRSLWRWSHPCTDLDRLWGFQEDEAPRFPESRHMKEVRLWALSIGPLYPQGKPLVFICVRGWVGPRNKVRPEGLSHCKTWHMVYLPDLDCYLCCVFCVLYCSVTLLLLCVTVFLLCIVLFIVLVLYCFCLWCTCCYPNWGFSVLFPQL
jgi:hypothetical protein